MSQLCNEYGAMRGPAVDAVERAAWEMKDLLINLGKAHDLNPTDMHLLESHFVTSVHCHMAGERLMRAMKMRKEQKDHG